MGILSMWREARGTVMRNEYEDAMARMKGANDVARRGFFNEIVAVGEITPSYASMSKSERKVFAESVRKKTKELWDQDFWPEALGLVILMLNAESHFVLGSDAAFVKSETDRIIKEAHDARQNST
jgi:hypothetical protein